MAHEPIEIVERKGLGHLDSLCDALAAGAVVAVWPWPNVTRIPVHAGWLRAVGSVWR